MWSNGRSDALTLPSGVAVPIRIRPMRSARRLRLRYDEADGCLKLTCPNRTSRRAALRWALDQSEWITAQLARASPPELFEPGAVIPVAGVDTRLVWDRDVSRGGLLEAGELRVGGSRDGFSRRVEAFLRRLARDTMSADVARYAAAAGVSARGVSIGDAARRWGSCSSHGQIRLSWRLIMAPVNVRRYVVAHEVAHLVHLDHGSEFKRLEARLFGHGVAEAKACLTRVGPRLRRLGGRR